MPCDHGRDRSRPLDRNSITKWTKNQGCPSGRLSHFPSDLLFKIRHLFQEGECSPSGTVIVSGQSCGWPLLFSYRSLGSSRGRALNRFRMHSRYTNSSLSGKRTVKKFAQWVARCLGVLILDVINLTVDEGRADYSMTYEDVWKIYSQFWMSLWLRVVARSRHLTQ